VGVKRDVPLGTRSGGDAATALRHWTDEAFRGLRRYPPVLLITIMRKIKVWKWNRNLLLVALLATVAVAALFPPSKHVQAIESGPSAAPVSGRTSTPLGMHPAGGVRVPSLARLSRYGAPVSEVVMVATVRAVGLRPIVTRLRSTRPEGTVLFTTPGSGVEVVPDSSVDIVVSDGKASHP
jgi:PASTA domain